MVTAMECSGECSPAVCGSDLMPNGDRWQPRAALFCEAPIYFAGTKFAVRLQPLLHVRLRTYHEFITYRDGRRCRSKHRTSAVQVAGSLAGYRRIEFLFAGSGRRVARRLVPYPQWDS